MTSNPLWDLLQAYMDSPLHEYSPRPADLARKTGVSEQVLSKWKQRPVLPTPAQLGKVASGTGLPFSYLLEAALQGRGYLPSDAVMRVEDLARPDEDLERARLERLMSALQFAIRRRAASQKDSAERDAFERDLEERFIRFFSANVERFAPEMARRLSAANDNLGDLIAAHEEEGSISGEQEESDTP